MLTCPRCDAEIDIEEDEVDEGESVGCDECGADLKVLGKTPLELTPVDEIEKDQDEDEIFDAAEEEIELAEDEEEEEESF